MALPRKWSDEQIRDAWTLNEIARAGRRPPTHHLEDKMSILQYLRQQLGGNFTAEYMALSPSERDELKKWAREEMIVLGIPTEPEKI